MNFLKTIIPIDEFQKIKKLGNKYAVRFNEVTQGDSISCIECMTDYVPTEEEIDVVIKKEANDYFLPLEKKVKIDAITEYDKSSAVNSFSLSGNDMWLSLEERKSMRQSLIALKAEGIETFTYWNGLTPITMPVAQFESMLNAVEIYALQCFNVTAQHKANVMALESIVSVNVYDFTTGYPEKLAF